MDPVAKEGSAFARMFDVLAAPGEVFEEIKERPVNHANWVVPAVIWLVIGIAGVLLLFSQEWAIREVRNANEKGMQQQVRAGKLTQEQADQGAEFSKRFLPLIVKIIGSVAVLLYAFGLPFFWGFVIWVLGTKAFKADFEYMKAVEAAGLASIIYAIAGLLGALVSLAMGKFVYLSAAFSVSEFDFTSKQHFALAALNPFYLWYAAVIALALAIMSGVSWAKAAGCVLVVWIATRVLLILTNLGQFTM